MLNFGASKPRVGGARAPGPPLDPHLVSIYWGGRTRMRKAFGNVQAHIKVKMCLKRVCTENIFKSFGFCAQRLLEHSISFIVKYMKEIIVKSENLLKVSIH